MYILMWVCTCTYKSKFCARQESKLCVVLFPAVYKAHWHHLFSYSFESSRNQEVVLRVITEAKVRQNSITEEHVRCKLHEKHLKSTNPWHVYRIYILDYSYMRLLCKYMHIVHTCVLMVKYTCTCVCSSLHAQCSHALE